MGSERRIEEPDAGPVSAEEAREIAQRFIDRHFDNEGELPRISIPADPKRDDDIRLVAFIEQSNAVIVERDRLRVRVSELEALTDAAAVGAEMDRLLARILDVQADAARAQDERDRLRRELEALRDEMDRHAHESDGDLFDDLLTRVLKRYADRLDAILRGG